MKGSRLRLGISATALIILASTPSRATGQVRSMVEVEGHPMRVVSAGLDTRDPRVPVTPGGRAGYSALFDFQNKDMQERALPDAPNVPTSVVSAARRPAPSVPDRPFDFETYWHARRDARDANLRSWVREGGE